MFDGSGKLSRDELAPTGPLSVYGMTKLEGEALIRASGCRNVILRTSWVYAARGHNFIKTMLRLAGERETLSVIDDQIGAPKGAELLLDITSHVIRSLSEGRGEEGTVCWSITNGRITKARARMARLLLPSSADSLSGRIRKAA